MDVERLADGLWRWTTAEAGSVYYEAPDAVILFDPLLPAGEEKKFLAYLDRDVDRLGLPVSILLTDARHERSALALRQRYDAGDRAPETIEVHPAGAHQVAYFIRPHRALVVASLGVSPAGLPVELVLPSKLAG